MSAPRIAGGELNYAGVGATETGVLPEGSGGLVTQAYVGDGEAAYRRAVQGMLTWQLQKRAGLRVRAESDVVLPGTRVVSGFGVGPLRINAPCEVVTAFGVPANWFYAVGGAVTARARRHITSRYLRSAQELAAGVS